MSETEVKELADRMRKVEIELAAMKSASNTLRWVLITLISASAVASPALTAILLN
ncbi:MAG: hypothetical protein AAF441_21315 [Pseudomonadota bacterium]